MTVRFPMRTPGQMMGAAANPNVGTDFDRFAKFRSAAELGVQRMRGRVDLYGWAEHGVVANFYLAAVEDDAVEVKKDALAEVDVFAVVAKERGLDDGGIAACAE